MIRHQPHKPRTGLEKLLPVATRTPQHSISSLVRRPYHDRQHLNESMNTLRRGNALVGAPRFCQPRPTNTCHIQCSLITLEEAGTARLSGHHQSALLQLTAQRIRRRLCTLDEHKLQQQRIFELIYHNTMKTQN